MAIGIATLDIINHVASYPSEDDEVRAISQTCSRGGNATNTLAILSQLKHQSFWAGSLANETNTKIILDDLDSYQIDYSYVDFLANGKIPTSYITLNEQNASRTIVHYRDLPEYNYDSFKKIQLGAFDWIHFEGRNIEQVEKMLARCKQSYPHIPISLEVEKKRPNISALFSYADVLMFSKSYAQTTEADSATKFLQQLPHALKAKTITCTWGEKGAALLSQGSLFQSPAFLQAQNINTLAAGDTFNAAIIDNLLTQRDAQTTLSNACRLAAQKCAAEQLDFLASRQPYS